MERQCRMGPVLRALDKRSTSGQPLRARPVRQRGQQGAVLVEAALVLPIMILVVMGIIEFGFAFASSTTTTGSSRSGARLGAAREEGAAVGIVAVARE